MRPLVLVHGFLGGGGQWVPQAPLGEGRGLVTPDLPGFGERAAEAPLSSIGEMAEWVLEELSALGVGSFDLLGHSMGGMIVQEMARRAPGRVARLILYSTGAIGELPGRFEPIATSMDRARADGPQATARRIAATWFREGPADPQYPACAAIAERAGLEAILAGLEAMRSWSGERALGEIRMPALVLWGDRDRTYPWTQTERLWKGIAGAALAVVPGAAHAVHLEKPALFNLILRDFLSMA